MSKALFLFGALVVFLLGVYLKQAVPGAIAATVLVAVALAGGSTTKASAPARTSSGVKVQPIIVRRKYVGPENIYPEKMDIVVYPEQPSKWWATGLKPLGSTVGTGIRRFKNWLTE